MKLNNVKPLDYYHEQFCKQMRAEDKTHATIRNYKDVYSWLKLFKKDIQVKDLTHDLMLDFMNFLDTRPRKIGTELVSRELKASSKATVQGKLNPFFNYLKKEGVIKENPLARIEYPKVNYDDEPYFDKEEFAKIVLNVMSGHKQVSPLIRKRNIAMVMFLALTGLRRNEFLNVRLEDIDFKKKKVYVRPETSKSRASRSVPLHDELVPYLKDYLHERKEYSCPLLWVSSQSDSELTEHGLKHFIHSLTQSTKINCHVHRFRHTFAVNTYLLERDLLKLKTLLGHKTLKMTLGYLRSIKDDELVRNVAQLTTKEFI